MQHNDDSILISFSKTIIDCMKLIEEYLKFSTGMTRFYTRIIEQVLKL